MLSSANLKRTIQPVVLRDGLVWEPCTALAFFNVSLVVVTSVQSENIEEKVVGFVFILQINIKNTQQAGQSETFNTPPPKKKTRKKVPKEFNTIVHEEGEVEDTVCYHYH